MKPIYYILPLMAGIAISIQAGINSQLRTSVQNAVLAALISFLGGTLALLIILALSPEPLPSASQLGSTAWYKWIGGLLGAFVVVVSILSVQKIGAAGMFVLFISGQLLMAVVIDHFGLLGILRNPITLQKILGILLLALGAYLVNKK